MISLGARAARGGCVLVAVRITDQGPEVVRSTFMATCAEGDRLAREPYHVAAEMVRASDGRATNEAAVAVAEGRARQVQMATTQLERIACELRAEPSEHTVGALLVNRATWITDLLSYSLAWDEHRVVAEGLAVREAIRAAFRDCEIACTDVDEKSLIEVATSQLPADKAQLEARLTALGARVGRPWRREQKLACLAAWLAIQQPRR